MAENTMFVSDNANVLRFTDELQANAYPGRGLMLGWCCLMKSKKPIRMYSTSCCKYWMTDV